MFTFIKKVIKTGTATSSYPLEPIAVDKNFRGKPTPEKKVKKDEPTDFPVFTKV